MNFKELADKIGLDEEDYRELIELFVETGTADYDQLKSALESGDHEQVSRSAHTISGASGNLGLMTIHEAAKSIEGAANDNRLDQIDGDIEALQRLFQEIAQCVQA